VTVALVMSIPMLMDPMVLSILYVWCQLNKVRTFFLLDSSQYLSKLDFYYIGDAERQRTDADPKQGCGSGSSIFFILRIRIWIQFWIQSFDDQKLKKFKAEKNQS
jgi:hypothetical protein